MTLSTTEKKMIERLRRREAVSRRCRWPLAFFLTGVVISFLALLVRIARFPDDIPNLKPLVVAFLLPPLFLFATASAAWLAYVIANWNGNPKTHLLLRLLDEHHTNVA